MSAIGRNEICPCGSGLKYKKCCIHSAIENKIEASAQMLKARSFEFAKSYGYKEPLYFQNRPGMIKMSEVLLEFAEPLIDKTDGSKEQLEKALTIAIMAWNIASEGDIESQLDHVQDFMKSEEDDYDEYIDDLTIIFRSLIQRKIDFYSDVDRLIKDFDIVNTGDRLHVNVVSTFLSEDTEAETFNSETEKISDSKDMSICTQPHH